MTIPQAPVADPSISRSRRFELLTQLPEGDARALAEHALTTGSVEVDIIIPPTVGMLMARVVDGAKGDLFNLAEVLVTEARVTANGHDGWAMVMGRRPDYALAVALIDACAEASPEVRATVEQVIRGAAAERTASDAQSWHDLAPTRVDFEISN
jgi:alpha-D-ribose 1-methylphosphonate 5-triphosphate synthase subunit PhnG